LWTTFLVAAVLACAGWAVLSAWRTIEVAGADTLNALWLLPALIALHLTQLLISAHAWRALLPEPPASLPTFYRLRVVREGIDSLLPVAQVGGELVGAQLLARCGTTLAEAAASVVVDVTIEFLTQLIFLLMGLATWAILAPEGGRGAWLGTGLLALAAVALVMAQRFGLLRLVEALVRQIALRFPALADVSLDGLHAATVRLYRRRGPMMTSSLLHLLAWILGTVETWAVLHTLGLDAGLREALVIESLGMAARSAGFAIPGALVVQETGFVLAAAAAGLPEAAGLSLSLVKRVREVMVGLIGLALWRRTRQIEA
jgi:putative membrane protein